VGGNHNIDSDAPHAEVVKLYRVFHVGGAGNSEGRKTVAADHLGCIKKYTLINQAMP
jgi:hypothetical protein